MSFSSQVKQELEAKIPAARHCQLAELAAFFLFTAHFEKKGAQSTKLVFHAEHEGTIRKCFTILQKAFNIEDEFDAVCEKQSITVVSEEMGRKILQAVKQWDNIQGYVSKGIADSRLLQNDCCRRAFIRGCFLAAGSVSTPEKFYHFEIVCMKGELAGQIQNVLHSFDIDAKIVLRKKYYVVYVKEGDQISDVLSLMDAPRAVMEFENVRVLKEVRNRVNRNVNCETANINKTAAAAAQQLEDIALIRDHIGLENLPDSLGEVARARLEMPEASLIELGEHLDPPVGKSGVNHRLRKLRAMAEQYKVKLKEEN